MRENILKGSSIGFALLISSILSLRFTNDIENTLKVFQYFVPILIGYILIGIVIEYFHNRPPKNNISSTRGVGLFYYLFIISTSVLVLANFIPDYIRYIILINLIVIFALWLADYIAVSKVAKELNGVTSFKNRTVIIDLESKPKTHEEFFNILEKHCKTSNIILEYIEKDLPAIVKMNGVLSKAEIGYYYGFTGIIVYTLKITEL